MEDYCNSNDVILSTWQWMNNQIILKVYVGKNSGIDNCLDYIACNFCLPKTTLRPTHPNNRGFAIQDIL